MKPEKFWAKTQPCANGCLVWTGWKTDRGYGRIRFGRGRKLAHRHAYEIANGPIPEGEGHHGICVIHVCDNPACVNPEHLQLGTAGENNSDRSRKSRSARSFGEANPFAKLTEEQVLAIRADRRALYKIAADYAISDTTVYSIKVRKLWPHI